MRLGLATLTLFLSAACGRSNVLPDGGRVLENCSIGANVVVVTVLDAQGAPVAGATVTAVNSASGHTVSATTNGSGITTGIDESVGEGTSLVTATSGSRTSNAGEVVWTCDPCHCTPSPAQLTVSLGP